MQNKFYKENLLEKNGRKKKQSKFPEKNVILLTIRKLTSFQLSFTVHKTLSV